jgi:hypothetical protein
MFRPVGDLPPSIYWRRRLALAAAVILVLLLAILTARVLSSGSSAPTASGSSGNRTSPTHGGSSTSPSHHPSRTKSHSPSSSTHQSISTSPKSSRTSSAPPGRCTASELDLSAASDHPSYTVGDSPVLSIVVKNVSANPCVQDLADPQVVLRVYNGESRVWGSHDCKIQPGTDDRTLMAGAAVRVSIVWSGLSSQPNNCANRQRAGAGTYTLYGSLSGREGRAAQFTMR